MGRRAWPLLSFLLLWALGVGAGVRAMVRYQTTPGEPGAAPPTFPVDQPTIAFRPGRQSLVMFVHPFCPCSLASVTELQDVLRDQHDAVDLHLVLMSGGQYPIERAPALQKAKAIDGLQVHRGARPDELARFGARTSGHVLLYGADGQLAFSGGITQGRGHVGDNDGARRLKAALGHGAGGTAPVFGCALDGTSSGGR